MGLQEMLEQASKLDLALLGASTLGLVGGITLYTRAVYMDFKAYKAKRDNPRVNENISERIENNNSSP